MDTGESLRKSQAIEALRCVTHRAISKRVRRSSGGEHVCAMHLGAGCPGRAVGISG